MPCGRPLLGSAPEEGSQRRGKGRETRGHFWTRSRVLTGGHEGEREGVEGSPSAANLQILWPPDLGSTRGDDGAKTIRPKLPSRCLQNFPVPRQGAAKRRWTTTLESFGSGRRRRKKLQRRRNQQSTAQGTYFVLSLYMLATNFKYEVTFSYFFNFSRYAWIISSA